MIALIALIPLTALAAIGGGSPGPRVRGWETIRPIGPKRPIVRHAHSRPVRWR
ncbi:hypothetical protein [Roseateles depolymerans]|uniref:hypothetical protein n=1 Tax=Roseateles depolymerans TaxID=76731 RepID=UPI001E457E5B|nr:hypothetical protein [Roseateles depolymerans]